MRWYNNLVLRIYMDWTRIIVYIFAGIGAGLGTGFAGLSAAAFIAPMLVAFLDFPAYDAVGIALVSDVLASAVSTTAYAVDKNVDFKKGAFMLAIILCFTMIGSYLASLVDNHMMGSFSIFATSLLGLKFILRPVNKRDPLKENLCRDKTTAVIQTVAFSSGIGMICGFVGAGGGMMMLLVLTSFLGFELKKAVGTSVFIMTFTALTGAVAHFGIGGIPDTTAMFVCILSTLISAQIAAAIATRVKPKTLNITVGAVLVILGITMLVLHVFF